MFLFTVLLLSLAVICQHRLFGLSLHGTPIDSKSRSVTTEMRHSEPSILSRLSDRVVVAEDEDTRPTSPGRVGKVDASA